MSATCSLPAFTVFATAARIEGAGEADVGTLTEACGAARPAVSQHLARLRLAGLVTTRKEGRRVVYALRHGHLRRLVDEALQVAAHQLGDLPPHD